MAETAFADYQVPEGRGGRHMSPTAVVILAVVVVAVALAGLFLWLRARSQRLERTFGPEYARAVHQLGKRKAETELEKREKRVKRLQIRELSQADRDRFAAQWGNVQAGFVDDPKRALTEADLLVAAVMTARGYPVQEFEQCAEDISVDHGVVVDNYRAAHEIAFRCARGEASTEEIRQAMLHYRTLFDDLLVSAQPDEMRLRRAG
jgi:hypothetical protein